MTKAINAAEAKHIATQDTRKDFVYCWTHANPTECREKISSLYDMLVKNWPEITRGGHRGQVGRLKPWETVVHTCPCCGMQAQGLADIKEHFGLRYYSARGKTYLQSYCRTCRREGIKQTGAKYVRINPEVRAGFTN